MFSFFKCKSFQHFNEVDLLNTIIKQYESDYILSDKSSGGFYVPISCENIAKKLKTDAELVFQYLYNYMDDKYAYQKQAGGMIHLFMLSTQAPYHRINYPYALAIYKKLKDSKTKEQIALMFSIISLIISLIAIFK